MSPSMPKPEYPLGYSLREHLDTYLGQYADYMSLFPRVVQIILNEPYVQLREMLDFVDREAGVWGVSLKDSKADTWSIKIIHTDRGVMFQVLLGDRVIADPTVDSATARCLGSAMHQSADLHEGKFPL